MTWRRWNVIKAQSWNYFCCIFFFFPVHKWTPPPRLPVGARPSPPPATVHVLPRGSERKMRAKRGCEIERKKICLRGCERDFHNLGEGENATPATSDSPRQEKTLRFSSLQHLNTFTSFTELGVRNREETGDGDKQWGGHSRAPLSGGSSPPSVPTYPVGWPARPRSPCCVVPAAVRDRACREGRGGKVTPIWYSRLSVVWDGGVGGHVSLCISDKIALPGMTLYPPGDSLFFFAW